MLQRSALTSQQKIQTAVNELIRRWKNTSEEVGASEIEKITMAYVDELMGMGYHQAFREEALRSALRGFSKISRTGRINRPGASTYMSRRAKRLTGKTSWFEQKSRDPDVVEVGEGAPGRRTRRKETKEKGGLPPVVETAVFIPHTPDGVLKKRLNEMEEKMGLNGRVKYVEELGSTLGDILCVPDPWKGICGRPKCFPCQSSEGKCHAQGVVYTIVCMLCAREGKTTQYFGESGRTGFDRGAEHLASLNSEDKKSVLVEHWKEKHSDQNWDYQHKILKSYNNPLQRQVHEGHLIANFKGDEVLNRKGEWGENLPPQDHC